MLASCASASSTNKSFNINFISNDYVTFSGSSSVNNGEDYVFTIAYNDYDKYDYSNITLLVNGANTMINGNNITIKNVVEDLTIEVKNITINQVGITFIATEGITFNGQETVDYGENYTFTISLDDEDIYNYSKLEVYAGEHKLDKDNDSYTIYNVTNKQTIWVSGITSNYVDVYYSKDASFTFNGEDKAKIGEDYSFSLIDLSAYIDASSIKVTVNDNEVNLINNLYTVNNVEEDLTIKITYQLKDPLEDNEENKGDNLIEDLD